MTTQKSSRSCRGAFGLLAAALVVVSSLGTSCRNSDFVPCGSDGVVYEDINYNGNRYEDYFGRTYAFAGENPFANCRVILGYIRLKGVIEHFDDFDHIEEIGGLADDGVDLPNALSLGNIRYDWEYCGLIQGFPNLTRINYDPGWYYGYYYDDGYYDDGYYDDEYGDEYDDEYGDEDDWNDDVDEPANIADGGFVGDGDGYEDDYSDDSYSDDDATYEDDNYYDGFGGNELGGGLIPGLGEICFYYDGFEKLSFVEGDFTCRGADTLGDSLVEVTGHLDCPLADLTNLERVGSLVMDRPSYPSLREAGSLRAPIDIDVDTLSLPNLQSVGVDYYRGNPGIRLEGRYVKELEMPLLTTVEGDLLIKHLGIVLPEVIQDEGRGDRLRAQFDDVSVRGRKQICENGPNDPCPGDEQCEILHGAYAAECCGLSWSDCEYIEANPPPDPEPEPWWGDGGFGDGDGDGDDEWEEEWDEEWQEPRDGGF